LSLPSKVGKGQNLCRAMVRSRSIAEPEGSHDLLVDGLKELT
jgi:hypothetical protein